MRNPSRRKRVLRRAWTAGRLTGSLRVPVIFSLTHQSLPQQPVPSSTVVELMEMGAVSTKQRSACTANDVMKNSKAGLRNDALLAAV